MNSSVATEMKAPLRPLHDRILIKRRESVAQTKSGLYKPEQAVEAPQEGVVIAVGPGKIVKGERIPVDVKVGDPVAFGKFSGNEIEIADEKFLILQESELFGVLPK